jgi:hypothetical protein
MDGLFRSCNYPVWACGSIFVSFFLFFSLLWRKRYHYVSLSTKLILLSLLDNTNYSIIIFTNNAENWLSNCLGLESPLTLGPLERHSQTNYLSLKTH